MMTFSIMTINTTTKNATLTITILDTVLLRHLFCVSFLLSVIFAECHLGMLIVICAECHLCWVSFMLRVIYAECHWCWVSFMLSVICAECICVEWHLCWAPFMLNVFILIVVILSVVAPTHVRRLLFADKRSSFLQQRRWQKKFYKIDLRFHRWRSNVIRQSKADVTKLFWFNLLFWAVIYKPIYKLPSNVIWIWGVERLHLIPNDDKLECLLLSVTSNLV